MRFLLLSLSALLPGVAPSQTLDVLWSVDATAKTTSYKIEARGPAGAACHVFAAGSLTRGLTLPFGTLWLDPGTLTPLAVVPLGATGYGSLTLTLPSASIPTVTVDLQGAIVGGSTLTLTSYVCLGHFATPSASEALAAVYDSTTDSLSFGGKGRPADLIESWLRVPGGGWIRLSSHVVPPLGMFAIGVSKVSFVPGGNIEVRTNGIYTVLRLL